MLSWSHHARQGMLGAGASLSHPHSSRLQESPHLWTGWTRTLAEQRLRVKGCSVLCY